MRFTAFRADGDYRANDIPRTAGRFPTLAITEEYHDNVFLNNAAVASFLTPIGHHGNLLVYGPGRYRFADFVRVSTPLTVLVALVVAFLAQVFWPR